MLEDQIFAVAKYPEKKSINPSMCLLATLSLPRASLLSRAAPASSLNYPSISS
jgi:hypothetical protein